MVFCSFLLVCFSVCLYLIQIHISEPIWTKLCTRLPLRLEEVVRYVWTHNIWPFSTSSVRNQYRILGTTWLPAQESLRQRYIRDLADDTCAKSHPWQRYIRDMSDDTCAKNHPWQSYIHDIADDTCAKSHPWQSYMRDIADDNCAFVLQVPCTMHRQRGEENGMHACQYGKPDETRRKWIMNFSGNCIAVLYI
jgi:hypothetical protein